MDARPEPACGIEKSRGISEAKLLAQVHMEYQQQSQDWNLV